MNCETIRSSSEVLLGLPSSKCHVDDMTFLTGVDSMVFFIFQLYSLKLKSDVNGLRLAVSISLLAPRFYVLTKRHTDSWKGDFDVKATPYTPPVSYLELLMQTMEHNAKYLPQITPVT